MGSGRLVVGGVGGGGRHGGVGRGGERDGRERVAHLVVLLQMQLQGL